MPKEQTEKCPLCNGKGKIAKPKKTAPARLRRRADIASKLRGEGYTIREIMALMGYKSPQSITLLLKETTAEND